MQTLIQILLPATIGIAVGFTLGAMAMARHLGYKFDEAADAETKKFRADVRQSQNNMEVRLLRSAAAQEHAALSLSRIADQLEKNGK